MVRSNIYVIKLKRNFLPVLFLAFTFGLVIFSKNNLPAVKSGLLLWANSVVPSLFPFFVATEVLMHTNIIYNIGKLFNPIMKPLFNVKGEGAFCFILGIISGYPVGAKIACNLRKNNICSKEECERLLSFTNNSGPLFIIASVGISMFGNTAIGILLFITHLLSSISVGFLFRFWKRNKSSSGSKPRLEKQTKITNLSFSNLGDVLSESITTSISTILLIGGFVIIFASIISILNSSGIFDFIESILSPLFDVLHISPDFIKPIFTGFLEITNGINNISQIATKKLSINIIFTSFLLGFGGISVLLQVLSIISKSDLSPKPYIIGKFLQGIIASFYTYILIDIFPFFNFNL